MSPQQTRAMAILAIAIATALLAVGCSDAAVPAGSGAAAPAEDGSNDVSRHHPVTVVAADYEYTALPTEIPAGIVDLTFENTGMVGHEVAMAGLGDTPIDRFLEDLRGGAFQLNGQAQPDYLDQVIVSAGPAPGETIEATFSMTPGRYAFFCVFTEAAPGDEEIPHYERGMLREVTVVEGDPDPTFAPADGNITSVDYGFEVDLEAGDRTVNFMNEGPRQIHLTEVKVYPEGVSAEEAEAAFARELKGKPAGIPEPRSIGYTGILSAGLGSTFRLDQKVMSGRTYLFACFAPDREGGQPHAIAHDEYLAVTIE
jgi:plastocyanin